VLKRDALAVASHAVALVSENLRLGGDLLLAEHARSPDTCHQVLPACSRIAAIVALNDPARLASMDLPDPASA
jgi:hypothetical protein